MFTQLQMAYLASLLVLWKLSCSVIYLKATDYYFNHAGYIKNDLLWRHLCATITLNYNE